MKKQVLIFLSLFCLSASYAQIPYYDAVNLSRLLDANNHFKTGAAQKDSLFSILSKYLGGGITSPGDFKVTAKNPFIAQYFNASQTYGTSFTDNIGTLTSAAGNLDVTNFADGIAQFLIARGKQELDIAFFNRFQNFLQSYPEIKIIFPTTASFINNIDSYNYAAMMPALRAGFQKDLNSLSSDLINLRSIANYEGYSTNPAIKKRADEITAFLNTSLPGRSVIGALIITDGIVKGTNAADVINNLAADSICTAGIAGDVFSNTIKFVDLLSQSIRSSDAGRIWITKQQISSLVKNDVVFKLYLGLVYAQNQNTYQIQFAFNGTPATLQTFLTKLSTDWTIAATEIATFKQAFTNAANAASDVADNAQSIAAEQKQTTQSSILLYADYASSISAFLKSASNLLPANAAAVPAFSNIAAGIQKFTSVIDNLVNACYYIKSQNYGALVLTTASVADTILSNSKYTFAKINSGDYIKYGTFMASVVEAKSAADVNAAIEAVALPAGSYSVKQKSAFNISLNGYIGYAFDFNSVGFNKEYAHGIYAPIGVSFTRGTTKKYGIPVTVFASIIDVGSLVSYRLTNGSTDSLKQNVRLESIISPSAQIFLEIPTTPVSVGAGWRMTPKLFYSNNSGFVAVPSRSVFNISFLIDIPIFTLHNTSY